MTGFLVEPGNVAELRERLAQLLADPASPPAWAATPATRVLAEFTWGACAARCLAAYSEILSKGNTTAP